MSFYTILMHAGTNTRFAVYKTTGDPNDQGTWAAVASSEIDFTNEVYSLWAVKDGTHIHIVTQEASTRRVAYHDFETGGVHGAAGGGAGDTGGGFGGCGL